MPGFPGLIVKVCNRVRLLLGSGARLWIGPLVWETIQMICGPAPHPGPGKLEKLAELAGGLCLDTGWELRSWLGGVCWGMGEHLQTWAWGPDVRCSECALLPSPKDLVNIEMFLTAKEVEESLERRETATCLAWCHDNKSRLRKMKVCRSPGAAVGGTTQDGAEGMAQGRGRHLPAAHWPAPVDSEFCASGLGGWFVGFGVALGLLLVVMFGF